MRGGIPFGQAHGNPLRQSHGGQAAPLQEASLRLSPQGRPAHIFGHLLDAEYICSATGKGILSVQPSVAGYFEVCYTVELLSPFNPEW